MAIAFDEWVGIGIEKGWCGPPVCYTHDGLPMSANEMQNFDDGQDPCMHIIRMYEDMPMKEEIEDNHFPSIWRNNYKVSDSTIESD